MVSKRLTGEEWAQCRALFECDPKVSYGELAKRFGVSKQAIYARAKAGGWKRDEEAHARLVKRAHGKADETSKLPEALPEDYLPSNGRATIDEKIESAVADQRPAAEDERSTVRAAILKRHREEITGPRSLAYEAMRGKNKFGQPMSEDERMFLSRLAKISMETLKGIQEMERKAWGFDTATPGEAVIIERY